MFFNYDSFEIVAIAFIVSGILIQSLYISSALPNESLVNTNSNLDLSFQSNNLATTQLIDASVQTDVNIQVEASVQAVNTYVNTGIQTSARMWLESIRNWITEILGTTSNTPATGQYVDVGVQTNAPSLWVSVKQWFLEVCSIRSSDLSSIGYNKVTNWRNKLDSIQSVDLHDSESPLTHIAFDSPNTCNSTLDKLVDPDESASQVTEVVSESSLQNVETVNRFYDMNNPADVLDLMNDPTVVFSVNPATLPGDDIITFYTAESANEILRSTLENLITSVN
jgi:hypothetical protein